MLPSAQPVTSEQGGHSPRVRAAESRAQAARPGKHCSQGQRVTSLTAQHPRSLHPFFRKGGRRDRAHGLRSPGTGVQGPDDGQGPRAHLLPGPRPPYRQDPGQSTGAGPAQRPAPQQPPQPGARPSPAPGGPVRDRCVRADRAQPGAGQPPHQDPSALPAEMQPASPLPAQAGHSVRARPAAEGLLCWGRGGEPQGPQSEPPRPAPSPASASQTLACRSPSCPQHPDLRS